MTDILVGRLHPFGIIACDQRLCRLTSDNGRELPGQILRVLNAGIGTPRTERRNLMGRIANEDRAAVNEAIEPLAIDPLDLIPVHH
jgi:hypothetical protein